MSSNPPEPYFLSSSRFVKQAQNETEYIHMKFLMSFLAVAILLQSTNLESYAACTPSNLEVVSVASRKDHAGQSYDIELPLTGESHSQNRGPDQDLIYQSGSQDYSGLQHKRATRDRVNNSFGLIYLPQGGRPGDTPPERPPEAKVIVKTSLIASPWAAWWFNPTTEIRSDTSGDPNASTCDTHPGSGCQQFTAPLAHHPGEPVQDWVLILESTNPNIFPGCDP